MAGLLPLRNLRDIDCADSVLVEADEYGDFIKNDPASEKYIRPFIGAEEFINGKERYCLWLVGATPAELRKMPLVAQRVGAVRKLRESSPRGATRKLAETPWLFGEIRQPHDGNYLLVPRVSSENRRYIPIGFLSSDIIASDATLITPQGAPRERQGGDECLRLPRQDDGIRVRG